MPLPSSKAAPARELRESINSEQPTWHSDDDETTTHTHRPLTLIKRRTVYQDTELQYNTPITARLICFAGPICRMIWRSYCISEPDHTVWFVWWDEEPVRHQNDLSSKSFCRIGFLSCRKTPDDTIWFPCGTDPYHKTKQAINVQEYERRHQFKESNSDGDISYEKTNNLSYT